MKITKQELAILHYWLEFPEEICRKWFPEEDELSKKIEQSVDSKLYEKFCKKVKKSYDHDELTNDEKRIWNIK